jgi:hypothetical protein
MKNVFAPGPSDNDEGPLVGMIYVVVDDHAEQNCDKVFWSKESGLGSHLHTKSGWGVGV